MTLHGQKWAGNLFCPSNSADVPESLAGCVAYPNLTWPVLTKQMLQLNASDSIFNLGSYFYTYFCRSSANANKPSIYVIIYITPSPFLLLSHGPHASQTLSPAPWSIFDRRNRDLPPFSVGLIVRSRRREHRPDVARVELDAEELRRGRRRRAGRGHAEKLDRYRPTTQPCRNWGAGGGVMAGEEGWGRGSHGRVAGREGRRVIGGRGRSNGREKSHGGGIESWEGGESWDGKIRAMTNGISLKVVADTKHFFSDDSVTSGR